MIALVDKWSKRTIALQVLVAQDRRIQLARSRLPTVVNARTTPRTLGAILTAYTPVNF